MDTKMFKFFMEEKRGKVMLEELQPTKGNNCGLKSIRSIKTKKRNSVIENKKTSLTNLSNSGRNKVIKFQTLR